MTLNQQIITIAVIAIATVITRFLPFIVFSENRQTPEFVKYIGNYLPPAVFGMLIVYCLKDVNILAGSHGIPEFIAVFVTAALHIWRRQMLISIAGGTVCYMLLLHFVFV